ncbi:MAG: trigger factor [Candidatus Eremiobacteraeota bacterium]|nr:trigger factor [Candidatus Eremiobacteraeota bacterium]
MTKLAPTQVELEIPISAEELRAAEDRAFRKLSKNAKLPGFRPGKVPRKIFEQTYGAEMISSQAIEDVVPEIYAKAVREHDLAPVDRPKMELLPQEEGKPTRLKAVVEVRPEFELKTYKGIQLDRPSVEVADADVERSLTTLARERATLVPAEREARLGDVVTVDYEGKIDGVPFDGGAAQGQVTELREDRFIPGFATGIAGMQPGQTKDVEATFPEEYGQAELAGKKAVFTITLHEIKEFELPALDDEFAKAVSQNQTLDELKTELRERLGKAAEQRVRRDLGNQLVDKLVDQYDFTLPDALIQREIDSMMNDAASFAARIGMPFDEYLKQSGKTEEQQRDEYRSDAERRVKATLILESIAKAEKINATPADVQAELAAMAQQYGQPVDRIRQALGNNVLALMDGIVRNKTVDFLIDAADIKATTAASS